MVGLYLHPQYLLLDQEGDIVGVELGWRLGTAEEEGESDGCSVGD